MTNKTPADGYVFWVHETEVLYWRDCLGDKLWFVSHLLGRGFLFTEDPQVHKKIDHEQVHEWKSKGTVPDGCLVVSDEVIKRCYLKAIKEDVSPFEPSFIANYVWPA